MDKKPKYLPKKLTDTNILRSMLKNINEQRILRPETFKLSSERFNAYISALNKHGIVSCTKELPVETSEDLIISDIPQFNEWNRSYDFFNRKINKLIIPILQIILSTTLQVLRQTIAN